MNAPDVCILGTGPVAASLALALARQGISSALTTAPPGASSAPPPEDVRTYALNAGSVALLRALRVWDALPVDAATAVDAMRIQGDAGGTLEFSAWQQRESALAWIVDAQALDTSLAQALLYAPHVQRVAQPVDAPLQAICEGKNSAARAAHGVNFKREAYGHSALAARIVSDAPHQGVAHQWFRNPDILALLPFDRPVSGSSFGLVWSMPHEDAVAHAVLDPEAFEATLNGACGAAAGTLRLGSARLVWPLAAAQAEPCCGPGWVLLGDAAHQVHPLAGQGLNLGLADVSSLARILGQARREEAWRSLGDERLLRRHVRERAWHVRSVSGVSDGLWQLFSRTEDPVRTLRNQGMSLLNKMPSLKRWLVTQAMASDTHA